MLEINKEKLKLKYLIGVETESPIDAQDFLFNLIKNFEEKNWDFEKGCTISHYKHYGTGKTIAGMDLEGSFSELEKLGYLEKNKINGTFYYKIVSHPWK